jgi:hypothetical protein
MASLSVSAQDKAPVCIGFESGFSSFENNMRDLSMIREYSADFGYNDYADVSLGTYELYYAGLKMEKPITNRLSISSGLRYTRTRAVLKPENGNTMYLLLSSEGSTTEYLRASSINENSDYLGIPFEGRFYTSAYHFVRFYLKAGAVLNYRIKSDYHIDFTDSSMSQYETRLTTKLGEPDSFNAVIFGGGGIRLGRLNGPSMNIEALYPSFVLTPNSSRLTTPIAGGGVMITLQFPLNFNSQKQ